MTDSKKKQSIWRRKIKWPRPIAWLFHFIFSPKMLRVYLFALACCITLIIAFYTVENIRGSLAWSQHVKELRAAGISRDFRDYIPPEIPDEENLAKIPMFAAFEYERIPSKTKRNLWDHREVKVKWKDKSWGPLKNLSIYYRTKRNNHLFQALDNAEGRWQKTEPTDLSQLQVYYRGTNAFDLKWPTPRAKSILENTNIIQNWAEATNSFPYPKQPGIPAEDVLIALKKYDSIWEELKTASQQRKKMRFPLHYNELFGCLLPHLTHIKSIHRYGKLRATAELVSGKHQEATESIRLMMQINNGLRHETFFISHLVRIANIYFSIHPIWEGINRHAFKAEDLRTLSSEFENIHLLAELPKILRMECSVFAATMEVMEEHRHTFYRYFGPGTFDEKKWPGYWTSDSYMNFAPTGWFKQNMLFYSQELRALEHMISNVIQMKPNAILSFEAHLKQSLEKPLTTYNVLAKQLYLYKNKESFYKSLTAENTIRIVKTAIALERYFLEHQKYPKALDLLVPAYLPEIPLNLYNGQVLQYKREQGGRFTLSATGWEDTENKDPQGKPMNRANITWSWPPNEME